MKFRSHPDRIRNGRVVSFPKGDGPTEQLAILLVQNLRDEVAHWRLEDAESSRRSVGLMND